MESAPNIRRAFADLAHGQVHYRTAGSGAPLLMIHASPGSSRQLAGLVRACAGARRVIAPDTPGNGDSPALPIAAPEITDLAAAYLELLDVLGLDRLPVYGSHTGAAIAVELAILAPGRIERLVLDGVQRLTDEARGEMLARYASPFRPEMDGAHLIRAFQFCRDQCLFYPWYDNGAAARRSAGLPGARALHDWVVEVLKASETYHLNYQAAFRWRAEERLVLVDCPTLLIAADDDPLAPDTRGLAPLVRTGRHVALPRHDAPDYVARRTAAIAAFLETALPPRPPETSAHATHVLRA